MFYFRYRFGLCTAAVIGLFLGNFTRGAESAGELRYKGQAGQTYAYEINIKAETDDETDTLQGTVSFTYQNSTTEQLKVTYQGGLNRRSQPKPQSGGGFGGPPFGPRFRPMGPPGFPRGGFGPFSSDPFSGTRITTNQLVLSPLGNVVSMQGDSQLPYLLGNCSLMVFEPLPTKPQATWKVESGVSISEGEGRTGPPFFDPFRNNRPERTTAGSESATYTVERVNGPLVTVKKTYHLDSPAADENDAASELNGSGTWTFNRELGISESLDFQQQMVVRKKNVTITIPITLKYRRLSVEELNKMQAEAKKRAEEQQKALAEAKAKAKAPLDPSTRQQILDDLGSNNVARIMKSVGQLEGRSPKETDPEIVAALQSLLQHNNRTIKSAAERALAKWSSEDRSQPNRPGLAANADRGLRTWSDDTGQFQIEAVFIGFVDDKVKLRRKDGREVAVPINRLSAADQQVAERLKKQAAATNPFEP